MKTTRYFREQVLRKRPYIREEWCERILANPIARAVQPDGRIRWWGTVPELDSAQCLPRPGFRGIVVTDSL